LKHKGIVLWDIDGTLINIRKSRDSKHLIAVNKILKTNYKISSNNIGKTDLQVIYEIIKVEHKLISSQKKVQILEYLNFLTKVELQHHPVQTNPNVENTLKMIEEAGCINGILTGNTMERTKYKLDSARLTNFFATEFVFHGENSKNRKELVGFCKKQLSNKKIEKALIVGDSPEDIIAAKLSKIPVLAVATGHFTKSQLGRHSPDALINNLNDDYSKFEFIMNSIF
jgi:phosphoglycolate phosphatase